jgi:glycosyltransferase involved in cell wall biosynthesis
MTPIGTALPISGAVTLVFPCFNEGERLRKGAFLQLLATEVQVSLLFVDDGSTDHTADLLATLRAGKPRQIAVHTLARNSGKAEAVRQGLLRALEEDSEIIGYFDADLATPVPEIKRLIGIMRERGPAVLLGSRVALLGRQIERTAVRHYLGRVFATLSSALLHLTVYDTQCGAKLFRRSHTLAVALEEPFLSRWTFDVELLGRLLAGRPPAAAPLDPALVMEEPLHAWRDVPGSKLRPRHMFIAACDLARVGLDLSRRRKASGSARGTRD